MPCTRMLERGASLPIVASIMGWSPSTTAKMAKRYGHIGSTVQRAALDALATGIDSQARMPSPEATNDGDADSSGGRGRSDS
jgi:hypothetical protein